MTDYQKCPTCGKVYQGNIQFEMPEPIRDLNIPNLCQYDHVILNEKHRKESLYKLMLLEKEQEENHLTSTSEQGIQEILENTYHRPLSEDLD